ncbi:MAG: malto-oligosyltrehalose synthase [Kineosporiaceae bacterium]
MSATSRPDVVPVSTYRVQVQPGFGFDDVAGIAPYLRDLGVTHVYLSPVLQPVPGSTHGYDVVDHTQLNAEAGGLEAFERMAGRLRELGLGAVADVVPNHMAVPTPVRRNRALWSVLRDGPGSPYARWFDVDWSVPSRALLMPILGDRIGRVVREGQLTLDRTGPEPVLRYFDHEFPVRPGTEDLPLEELVERQWYRLAWWRIGDEELNYRRFFDVGTLAAIRVEDPAVFDATHELLLRLIERGDLQGLRIDHPDGLADPRGYVRRLDEATGGAWVVVEKILEGEEDLPEDWPCAGTTGYDALWRIGGLFVEPAGAGPLTSLLIEQTGLTPDLDEVVEQAKRDVVAHGLHAEVNRLVDLLVDICSEDLDLRDHPRRHLELAVTELLVAFERYRAYVVPGEPVPPESVEVVDRAVATAKERVPEEVREAVDVVRGLVLDLPTGSGPVGGRDAAWRRELVVRFQQTCGPVMAKGIEDTAFYRWHRLISLNEVGADPRVVGVAPEEFHGYCSHRHRTRPLTMTTLSTHDTKRSEDVRARIGAISELTEPWAEAVRGWSEAAAKYRSSQGWPDPPTTYLLWQTLVGLWQGGPPDEERVQRYLEKATREAKLHTSWTSPDPVFDEATRSFVSLVLANTELVESLGAFAARLDGPGEVTLLGQKLVQLTMPGVPDVYQGTETVSLTLVDPDNRAPVDVARAAALLADLDAGKAPEDVDGRKLLVTSRALRVRREHPEWFVGAEATYSPLPTSTGNAVAFARGDASGAQAITVVTRLPVALERRGGWAEHSVALPEGRWRDVLTGRAVDGGSCALASLLLDLPVALLVRDTSSDAAGGEQEQDASASAGEDTRGSTGWPG